MAAIDLSEITSAEAAAIAQQESVAGLIPVGAVEQHGPHLPLATDFTITSYLAREVASRVEGDVVFAPTLPGGLSSHHIGFPGTVDLSEQTVGGYVEAYVGTFVNLGIREIFLISGHGGNFQFLDRVAGEIGQQHEGLGISAYSDLNRYLSVMRAAAAEVGLQVPETDIHAGGLETSQMMWLIGEDRITVPPDLESYATAEPGWLDTLMKEGVDSVSSSGVLGQVDGATAAAGEAVCKALVGELAAWMDQSLTA